MTEQQLAKFWWWQNEVTWKGLNEKMENGHDSQGAKQCYERAAFVYEVRARLKPWKRRPNWLHGKPFHKLASAQIAALTSRYRSDQVYRDFRSGIVSGSSSSGGHSISLNGLSLYPSTTTARRFQQDILVVVEAMMKKADLVWNPEPMKGCRNKPYAWQTLEDADRWHFKLSIKSPKHASDPLKRIRKLLRDYAVLEC